MAIRRNTRRLAASVGHENGYLTTLAAVYLAAPEQSDEEKHLEKALREAAYRLCEWGDDEVAEFVAGITRQHVESLQAFARPTAAEGRTP